MEKRFADIVPTVLLSLALCASAAPASAQTLTGRVLEEGRERPVEGVAVLLLTREGKHRAEALTDSTGVFHLKVPEAGDYILAAERVGYRTTRSPLLALEATGNAAIDLMMRPDPIAVEGVKVEVREEAKQFLQNFGLTPARLGRRWISRDDIEAMTLPGGAGDAIRWQGIPGVTVTGGDPTDRSICVTTVFRGGRNPCAMIVLNGIVVDDHSANDLLLDAHAIESIAVLPPMEAATFYGTEGGAGAVLIWTRQGGR